MSHILLPFECVAVSDWVLGWRDFPMLHGRYLHSIHIYALCSNTQLNYLETA